MQNVREHFASFCSLLLHCVSQRQGCYQLHTSREKGLLHRLHHASRGEKLCVDEVLRTNYESKDDVMLFSQPENTLACCKINSVAFVELNQDQDQDQSMRQLTFLCIQDFQRSIYMYNLYIPSPPLKQVTHFCQVLWMSVRALWEA